MGLIHLQDCSQIWEKLPKLKHLRIHLRFEPFKRIRSIFSLRSPTLAIQPCPSLESLSVVGQLDQLIPLLPDLFPNQMELSLDFWWFSRRIESHDFPLLTNLPLQTLKLKRVRRLGSLEGFLLKLADDPPIVSTLKQLIIELSSSRSYGMFTNSASLRFIAACRSLRVLHLSHDPSSVRGFAFVDFGALFKAGNFPFLEDVRFYMDTNDIQNRLGSIERSLFPQLKRLRVDFNFSGRDFTKKLITSFAVEVLKTSVCLQYFCLGGISPDESFFSSVAAVLTNGRMVDLSITTKCPACNPGHTRAGTHGCKAESDLLSKQAERFGLYPKIFVKCFQIFVK